MNLYTYDKVKMKTDIIKMNAGIQVFFGVIPGEIYSVEAHRHYSLSDTNLVKILGIWHYAKNFEKCVQKKLLIKDML